MAFFKNAQQPQKGTLEYYAKNYSVCRANLLAVILFSIISVVMLVVGDSYFLFSNYFATEYAYVGFMYLSGGWKNWEDAAEIGLAGEEFLAIMGAAFITVATVVLIALFLCWVFSKKSRVPFIVAAIIMGLDTVYVLLMFDIVNILFHIWIMYYLILAIKSWGDMKRLEAQGEYMTGEDGQNPCGYGNPYGGHNPYAQVNTDQNADDNNFEFGDTGSENSEGEN